MSDTPIDPFDRTLPVDTPGYTDRELYTVRAWLTLDVYNPDADEWGDPIYVSRWVTAVAPSPECVDWMRDMLAVQLLTDVMENRSPGGLLSVFVELLRDLLPHMTDQHRAHDNAACGDACFFCKWSRLPLLNEMLPAGYKVFDDGDVW